MASDYGDEAGGKLLDWMLRIGQEAGAEAMARSARELSERLAGIRGTIAGGRAEAIAADGAPTYAKLSLEELSGLPEYATIKEVVSDKLRAASVEHHIIPGEGRDWLLFKVEDGLATLMWTVPGGAQETGGPYMRDPRHPRHFTDDFKRQIVDLYNAGKPKREIMDEYDLGKSTVERWIKSINATGSPRAADNRTPEQNRILELERENRRLRMEVDVLKQAALIYARK
ncbi:MAG TPA: helix-turn-helix domain-containing protein [Coriobacteriaceae bacterium]|nr:helix-turn-helix domain-containing protein [Coriobacteriaceae bacterium]